MSLICLAVTVHHQGVCACCWLMCSAVKTNFTLVVNKV